jgi:Tfp pilus assembly protein PilF
VERSPAAQQLEFGVKVALKGSWVEAAFRFERAIALGGSSARAYNNLAVARESLGQFDRAREAYEKALAVKADQDEDRRIRENYERFLGFLKANRGAGAAP